MEHKHSELIKRWADDTSLVILYKNQYGTTWKESQEQKNPHWFGGVEYFLVCEKHAEVALHWLNGGDVQSRLGCVSWATGENINTLGISESFFPEEFEMRIKPKFEKVKVWVGVGDNSLLAMNHPEITEGFLNMTWTEVEVNKLIQ